MGLFVFFCLPALLIGSDTGVLTSGSHPGCTQCLLNDLDLTVESGGRLYYPNGRKGPDRINNAERVIIEGVRDGQNATITVTPYNLATKWQHYSLVATGCFGGVANQNFADECSVYDCPEEDKGLAYWLTVTLIPAGVILCCCGIAIHCWRKRRRDAGA